MKKHDFAGMSLDELWKLHEQIDLELEKKIKDEKRRLLSRLEELNRKSSSVPVEHPERRHYPKVQPKFRNPNDPTITWSGRGKHPHWINDLLKAGKQIEDFRI
jgi:DNA-binding protein H-NS